MVATLTVSSGCPTTTVVMPPMVPATMSLAASTTDEGSGEAADGGDRRTLPDGETDTDTASAPPG